MICEYCGKEHDGSYGSGRFCCKSCASKYAGQKTKEAFKKNFVYQPKLETRICEKCGKEFTVDIKKEGGKNHRRRFCSRSCANSHLITDEIRNKISLSVNNYYIKNNIPRLDRSKYKYGLRKNICVICGKEFEYHHTGNPKTCNNPECRSKYLSEQIKESGTGGYRENSGNGKGGWYKGISCQSTYELAWVIYNLDHDIKFKKCKKTFKYILEGKEHIYHPDFELEDETIIEIKGYYQSSVSLKEKAVLDAGYKYKILYKKDLKYCFDYIKEHYGKSKENIVTLYDESKGFITKTCIICGKEFKTRNKNQKCCCRSCNGKFKKDNQINGKHMVNDVLKLHKIISDTKEQEKLLQDGWRFGATFK